MNRTVWIEGARVALAPAMLVGQGGEAEVYDLGDGRVIKWWKPADHPDFAGNADAQAAASRRIAEGAARLRALPGRLPAAVVAPAGLALNRKKEVVGFVMPKVAGEPLHSYGEARWRRANRGVGVNASVAASADVDIVAILLALHDAIAGLHAAGVVIGDCNDLNILVDAAGASAGSRPRVHLIDVDSYQLPGFPCAMFSERFVDPRLCDASQLVPVRPHDEASDWFAFAAMALRSLLFVGPWGGVVRGANGAARALRRMSVLAPGVTYPRAARPLATLPDELLDLFRAIFERDQRGVFPRAALERLRMRRCSSCGEEHARLRCPTCAVPVAPAIVHGRLRWTRIAPPASEHAAGGTHDTPGGDHARVWLDGAALMRATLLGPERIGSVLAGQTRFWVGATLGIGFYRAGGYARGFVFRPDRGGLDDRVAMPALRGQLVAACATLGSSGGGSSGGSNVGGDERAYLWLTLADAGRLVTHVIIVDAQARVLATEQVDAQWVAGVAGACATGPHLFVPTDDGIVRLELVNGSLVQTRVFAETAALVSAGDRLFLHDTGLDVIRARDAIRMQLT